MVIPQISRPYRLTTRYCAQFVSPHFAPFFTIHCMVRNKNRHSSWRRLYGSYQTEMLLADMHQKNDNSRHAQFPYCNTMTLPLVHNDCRNIVSIRVPSSSNTLIKLLHHGSQPRKRVSFSRRGRTSNFTERNLNFKLSPYISIPI